MTCMIFCRSDTKISGLKPAGIHICPSSLESCFPLCLDVCDGPIFRPRNHIDNPKIYYEECCLLGCSTA